MSQIEPLPINVSTQKLRQHNQALPRHNFDESHDEEINLLEYWYVIKRRAKAIFGLTFVAALIGVLTAFTITPQYTSTIKILVEPNAPKVVSLDPLQGVSNIMYFYQTQYDIIGSRSVISSVIDKLKLEKHPVFLKAIPQLNGDEQINSFRNLITDVESVNHDKEQKRLLREKLIGLVSDNLSVKGAKNSQIINVSYESPDPVLSARIANAISDAYIEKGFEAKLALNKNASKWLNKRLAELRQKLEKSEEILRNYQQQESLVNTQSSASITSSKLGGITEALIKAQAQRAEIEIQYQQVLEVKNSGKSLESLPVVLDNAFIQTLKQEQVKLARLVSELSERYGHKHPKMISVKSDLKIADQRLHREVNKVIDGVTRSYENAVANVKKLKALSQQTAEESRVYQAKEFELAKLERGKPSII